MFSDQHVRIVWLCRASVQEQHFETLVSEALDIPSSAPRTWRCVLAGAEGQLRGEICSDQGWGVAVLTYTTLHLPKDNDWLEPLTMRLFFKLNATLAMCSFSEPGLDTYAGLNLSALPVTCVQLLLFDEFYGHLIDQLIAFHRGNSKKTWEIKMLDRGCRRMTQAGWFGSLDNQTRRSTWPWLIDIPTPSFKDPIVTVGFGIQCSVDVLARSLMAWMAQHPALQFHTKPGGLPLDSWVLLATARALDLPLLPTPVDLMESPILKQPFWDILQDHERIIQVALSSVGYLLLTYDSHLISLIFSEQEPYITVHFDLGECVDEPSGWAWQWTLLTSLARHMPMDWWAGGLWSADPTELSADDILDVDRMAQQPFVIQRRGDIIETRCDDGWFSSPIEPFQKRCVPGC